MQLFQGLVNNIINDYMTGKKTITGRESISGGNNNDRREKLINISKVFNNIPTGDIMKVDFIRNLNKFEDSIEDLKICVSDFPPDVRESIEGLVNYELAGKVNLTNYNEFSPMLDKEFEVYKKVIDKLKLDDESPLSIVKFISEGNPSIKYIKAKPHEDINTLRRSIKELPKTVKEVYVDFSNVGVKDSSSLDEVSAEELNEINVFAKESTHQIYEVNNELLSGGNIAEKYGGKEKKGKIVVPIMIYFNLCI